VFSKKQRRFLRSRAHRLHPVIQVGPRGVTEAICQELEQALLAHELVKLKIVVDEREQRDAYVSELCAAGHAQLVQQIGNVVVLYRAYPEAPKLQLPSD